MDCVKSNTDIIVSKKSREKVVRNIIDISQDGKWHILYNEETGKKSYVPIDPDYFNNYYHANKKLITCDICGCVILKKIGQHKKTMKCRLANFLLQDKLKLQEDVITT